MPGGPVVALRCDADREQGSGHVMRCLALAQGLRERGLDVVFIGSLGGLPGPATALAGLDMSVVTPAAPDATSAQLQSLGAAAVVVDSYTLDAAYYLAARRVVPVVAIADTPAAGALPADLVVNGGPVPDGSTFPPGALLGLRYTLVREDLTDLRPPEPPQFTGPARDILVVLGGTDPRHLAPALARAALSDGGPRRVQVICASQELREEVLLLPRQPGQELLADLPRPDLGRLACRSDLVVTASGTSLWELACLGRPMGLVAVAGNQGPNYDTAVGGGAAEGLGTWADWVADPQAQGARLLDLMRSAGRRTALAATAHALVDGAGRTRVAEAIAGLIDRSPLAGSVEEPDARGADR